MPLLRLLHQITTMYQNVRETQMELREQRPVQNVDSNVLHKNSSSSGSDIHDQVLTVTPGLDEKKKPSANAAAGSAPTIKVDAPSTATPTAPRGPVPATRTQSFAQRIKSTSKAVIGSELFPILFVLWTFVVLFANNHFRVCSWA